MPTVIHDKMANTSSAVNTTDVRFNAKSIGNVIIAVCEVAIIPVIVCGNVLVIVAVCRFKSMRSICNVMICSLAIGDLMMGGIYMPLKLALTYSDDLFASRVPCLVNVFLSHFSGISAMLFLSNISIERCYAVQFPFHYHSNMTIHRSVAWSAVTFVAAWLMSLPAVCGIDQWTFGTRCFNTNVLPSYYIWSVAIAVFVVHLVGFLCFLRVLAAEISTRVRNLDQSESRRQDSIKSSLILTVYVFSILCWIPQLIYMFISKFQPQSVSLFNLRVVSYIAVCSSGVNCFIYGTKNSRFRNAFRKMFRVRQVDPVVETETTTPVRNF